MEFVNGKDDNPYTMKNKKCLKPPTSQMFPWAKNGFFKEMRDACFYVIVCTVLTCTVYIKYVGVIDLHEIFMEPNGHDQSRETKMGFITKLLAWQYTSAMVK